MCKSQTGYLGLVGLCSEKSSFVTFVYYTTLQSQKHKKVGQTLFLFLFPVRSKSFWSVVLSAYACVSLYVMLIISNISPLIDVVNACRQPSSRV